MLLGITGPKINILETFPSLCRTLEISRDICDCDCDGSDKSFELIKFGAKKRAEPKGSEPLRPLVPI